MPTTTAGPGLHLTVAALRELLRGHLPDGPDLPDPTVVVQAVQERSVGLGRRTGLRSVAGYEALEVRGARVEAVLRLELWAGDRTGAEQASADVVTDLLGARDALRKKGVLRLALEESPPAEEIPGVGWRAAPVYRVLFEAEYADADETRGLIARIPVRLDREVAGSPDAETTTVTDALVRWDDAGAPPLLHRGPSRIAELATLHHWDTATPSGAVLLTRSSDGATGDPAAFTDLVAFLDAVTGAAPAHAHAQLRLPSLDALLVELTPQDIAVALGEPDDEGGPDLYEARRLILEPAVELPSGRDYVRVELVDPATGDVLPSLDPPGVLYLRALSEPARI